jgi:tRNA-guanine family transglycosylase
MLTDSGGFQVFSLEGLRTIAEEGVAFQSHVDGSHRTITPEKSVEIQWALGADIAMQFDLVVPGGADHTRAKDGRERSTTGWTDARPGTLKACRARPHPRPPLHDVGGDKSDWPIVQGAL